MSEDVVFELAPLSVQFFVNLQPRIAEFDADGFSVQDGDLLHKLAGDGVIVCGEFRFPPLNKFPQAVHPGRLASLPLIRLLERPKLVQDALPLLRDFSEPGVQFFVFRILRQRQRLFHQGPTYERLQLQMVRQSETAEGKIVDALIIRNMAFRNGKEIPLTEVPAWADIPPEEIIPGVQKPLFGRYKSPAVNRADVNGVGGMKITNGLDGVMAQAVEAYNRFNREYASGEKLTFISKALLDKDGKGNPIYPDGKKNMFMLMKGVGNKDDLIQEHTPDIRSADLEKGIEVNNRMVELLAGLSQGILTPPTTSYATATEMRAALNNTFSVITKFRRQLEKGTNDLLTAVDAIANRNNLSPIGPWTVQYDWSSAYIEQMNEHFTQLTMAEGIGAVEKAEVRSWLLDEDYETAKARVAQIAEESGAEYMAEAAEPPA